MGTRLALLSAVLLSGLAQAADVPAPPFAVQVDEDGVQRAGIQLDSYAYVPSHLIVQAGKPVELTLTSVTFITPHNFILLEPSAGLTIEQDIGSGKTVIVKFTPTKPGLYPFYCDKKLLFLPSHREKGMEGRLEVRE
ncbi:MAG: cupredoxin domain-containing protein [Nitrospirae bacterium]|nr:cupredoxin domain-containing protein [Nitrospirota bacterium]